jgi:cell division protein ZapA
MESSKTSVQVQIYGEEYTVRSEGDVQYIRDVAGFVDQKMRDIAESLTNKSPARVAILAALNIADELMAERTKRESGSHSLEERARSIITLLSEKIPDSAG